MNGKLATEVAIPDKSPVKFGAISISDGRYEAQ